MLVGVAGLVGCSSASSAGVDPSPAPAGPGGDVDASASLVITTQPADASVSVGATATFSVTTSGGAGAVTYQWKRNGVAVAGATSQSYTTGATAVGDDGATFTVDVVSTPDALTSAAAKLTVLAGSGKTWGPATQLNTGDVNSQPGDARVAMDKSGNAVAVWAESTAGQVRNAIWASRLTAGGAWSTAATIDNPIGNSSLPEVAMTPDGTAVAAFLQGTLNTGGIIHMMTARFAGSWAAPQVLDTASIVNADVPQIGVAADGEATATFLEPDDMFPRVWATRSTTAGAWGGPAVIDAAGGSAPAVTVATNGHTLATWLVTGAPGSRTVWASRNIGTGWTEPAQIGSDTGFVAQPIKTAADAKGDMIAVWSQLQGSGKAAVRAARMDAVTGAWNAPVTLNDGTRNATEEQVVGDADGNAVAVWYDENAGVFASRFTASTTTWSAPVAVSTTTPPSSVPMPRVALDSSGNAIAVWLQGDSGVVGTRLYAAHFAAAAGTWGAPIGLMVEPKAYAQTDSEQAPVVSVSANGDAVVVWYQRTDAPATSGIWSRSYH